MLGALAVLPAALPVDAGFGPALFRNKSTVLQPRMFSESAVVALIESNQFTPEHWPGSACFGGRWCAEPPNHGLI
jgi:hypothetical protein